MKLLKISITEVKISITEVNSRDIFPRVPLKPFIKTMLK